MIWLGWNLQEVLAPQWCRLCGRRVPGRTPVCMPCFHRLPWITRACPICASPLPEEAPWEGPCGRCAERGRSFERSVAPARYEGAVRTLILAYKVGRERALARFLARLFDVLPLEELGPFDVLTSVPSHWLRRLRRGFDPPELVARALAGRTGLAYRRLLVKTRARPKQVGLGRDARLRSPRGAFRLRRGADVRGSRILLLDDVLTTGATTEECARVLRDAGAGSVVVGALARD